MPPSGREEIFAEIYRKNVWGDPETRSGTGSGLARTTALRRDLEGLIRTLGVRRMLDLPCGEFHWMKEVALDGASYVGADIVPEIVERNRRAWGSDARRFLRLDMVDDEWPRADLVLCRDALVHLSFEDALRAIARLKASGSTYLLATTFADTSVNEDIPTGDWRRLNLEKPPFCFPVPQKVLPDVRPDGTCPDKGLALWSVAGLRAE